MEIYLTTFLVSKGRWQVSETGGCQPRWGHDGTELFYVERLTLKAVPIDLKLEQIVIGRAEKLFDDPRLRHALHWQYDVSADGRFVTVDGVADDGQRTAEPAIRITQNWYEEFREREQD